MVLHHSCSALGPWLGSTGEMISSRAEVCVYRRGEPLSCVKLVGKKYLGAFVFIYSQEAACIVHFNAVTMTATPFASLSSPIHSLSARTYTPSLSLAPSHLTNFTHTPHAPPCSWKGLHNSYNNGNWRPIDRTSTPSSFTEVAGVEVFWISSELCWQ